MATTRPTAAVMKAAQVPKPGGDFEITEREIPKPGPAGIRIKVQACGICHSDAFTKDGSCLGFNIRASRGTKLSALSTN